ncbi:MAG: OmpA family protein [Burkholderiaceae bacterium]|jgi:outer membrane protein OmpA-like peptidoglycan-associated protein|nr:OmpA family protein [Burkholderiaceae bacterium]
MKKTLIAASIAIAFAGCSSVPKPVVPDGSDRQPINSQAKIDDYKTRTAEETANYNERTALTRQVDSLNKQMAELKTYLLMMQMEKDTAPKARPVSPQAAPAPAKVKAAAPQVVGDGGESIEVRDQSVIFRVSHPFGKTEFGPSPELQEKLLKAAREAQHIDIRGRTDAAHDNPIDRDIALQRALRARRFLIANGVEPSKIRWSSLASGGYVADNKTIEGRSKNRRVEIETMDLDTAAFNEAGQVATKVGSAQ